MNTRDNIPYVPSRVLNEIPLKLLSVAISVTEKYENRITNPTKKNHPKMVFLRLNEVL